MRYNLKNPTSTLPAYIGTCLPICLYRPPCLYFRREEQEEAKVKDKEEEAEKDWKRKRKRKEEEEEDPVGHISSGSSSGPMIGGRYY